MRRSNYIYGFLLLGVAVSAAIIRQYDPTALYSDAELVEATLLSNRGYSYRDAQGGSAKFKLFDGEIVYVEYLGLLQSEVGATVKLKAEVNYVPLRHGRTRSTRFDIDESEFVESRHVAQ